LPVPMLTTVQAALLERLLRESGPRLLAYIRRAYGRRLDAEELVAETFSRAAANAEAVEKCQRPEFYLLTIARNLCKDEFRRRRIEPLPEESGAAKAIAGGSIEIRPRHEARQLDPERVLAVQEAVDALPGPLREIVALRISAQMKFEDIAELLDIPLGTALSRMHTAIDLLKRRLGVSHECAAAAG
jgi:RNA polymerase sigma factor (sigma-70 family)